MDGKLIFTKVNSKRCVLLMQDGKLVAVSMNGERSKIIGGIYIARIRDVSKELNACFAEIGKDKICFLPMQEMVGTFFLSNAATPLEMRTHKPKQGDLILVQGLRDAQKTKQPTVTTRISLSNKYFVVSLGYPKSCFSSKLTAGCRNRIRQEMSACSFLDENGNLKPWNELGLPPCGYDTGFPQAGLIFRTQCEDASSNVLMEALQSLLQEFREMLAAACYRNAFTCIKEPPSPWVDAITHFAIPSEYQEIVTDDPGLYEEMKDSELIPPGKTVRLYEDSYPLEKLYSIRKRLQDCLATRVWLKSGAYLIIEPTEALTVIDVNSGKYEASKGNQAFYRDVNLEAAVEIAYQMRLRNLSGIILVDFINMSDPKDQAELIKEMEHLLQKDRVRACVVDFTKLGLMEITRQRTVPTLREQAQKCGYPLPD